MTDNHVQEYFANCENIRAGDSDALRSEIHRLIHSVRASAEEHVADDLLRHLEACGLEQREPRDINEVRRLIMELTAKLKRSETERNSAQRQAAINLENVRTITRGAKETEAWLCADLEKARERVRVLESLILQVCSEDGDYMDLWAQAIGIKAAQVLNHGANNGSTPAPLSALEEPPGPAEGLVWSDDMNARR